MANIALYSDDNWTIEDVSNSLFFDDKDEIGTHKIRVSYFEDCHYKGDITIIGEQIYGCAPKIITGDMISKAEQCLIDNGIDISEAGNVLQAIGYILLDVELYDD